MRKSKTTTLQKVIISILILGMLAWSAYRTMQIWEWWFPPEKDPLYQAIDEAAEEMAK